MERKENEGKHQLISLKPVYIDRRGEKERMKQCWISGSNFLTNLCWRGEVAPHVWEAPGARMAEMEATGNLPKETTRSQWAWAQAFILWERGDI